MKRLEFGIFAVALSIVLGCGEMPPEPASATSAAAPPPSPAPPGDGSGGKGNHVASTDAGAASAPATPEAPAESMPADGSAPVAAPGTDEVAQVGVGAKGQNYGGPGLVTTPIEAYFRTEERIAFEVQIPKAMQLYKAEHNNQGPKTHDEYMNIIIKENGVQLPELPAGEEYFYDPATEQLMVRHPKK